jgi:phosphomannomutase
VRASNTQPILVARAEAKDASGFDSVVANLRQRLDQIGIPTAQQPATDWLPA